MTFFICGNLHFFKMEASPVYPPITVKKTLCQRSVIYRQLRYRIRWNLFVFTNVFITWSVVNWWMSFDWMFMQDGATPLWIACQMGHAPVVKELLEASADVDASREVSHHLSCPFYLYPYHYEGPMFPLTTKWIRVPGTGGFSSLQGSSLILELTALKQDSLF